MLRYGSQALRAYTAQAAPHKDSWVSALNSSCEWLREHCYKAHSMPAYSQDPAAWESLANSPLDPIPRFVRLALSSHAAYVERRARVRAWHEEINDTVSLSGVTLLEGASLPEVLRCGTLPIPLSVQGWSTTALCLGVG